MSLADSGPCTGYQPPEVWLPVVGYERTYEVSNHGRIRRIKGQCGTQAGRILNPTEDGGYQTVSLSQDGIVTKFGVHRIVVTAFCGPEPFEGAEAAHNDGNGLRNVLWNLRWASGVDNQGDRVRHKTDLRGSRVFGAKLTEDDVAAIKRRFLTGERNPSIAAAYGVSISAIHLIRHERTWRHVA